MTRKRSALFGLLAAMALLAWLAGWRGAPGMAESAGGPPRQSTGAAPDSLSAAQSATLGPALFLLGPLAEGAALPTGLPVTVHARLLLSGGTAYVASGAPDAADQVRAAGVRARLLDPDTAGRVYYFLDAAAGDARGVVEAAGAAVLYAGERELLAGLPDAGERRLLDAAAAGTPADRRAVGLALLPSTALAAETPRPVGRAAGAQDVDPLVAGLLPLVTESALSQRIGELSGVTPAPIGTGSITFTTRYTWGGQISSVEQYLHQFYAGRGLAPRYVSWTHDTSSGRNVVMDILGSEHPERIWLIGGHFDSISDAPTTSAPGADDNATGTAATLVIADVLRGYEFADTIRFIHFGAEEQGMWGSQSYAANLSTLGAQVMGYIDLDMIGYDSNDDRVVELHSGTGAASNDLAAAFISANARYGQGLSIELKGSSASRFSDHSSFWDKGYPAFLAIEDFYADAIPADRNPYYHKTGDSLSRVDLDYTVRTARAALATIAEQAGISGALPPTATPTATATATSTATPAPCEDLIVNGGFETSDAWILPATAYSAGFAGDVVRSGSRSLRTGIVNGDDVYSYSGANQAITIPAGAASAQLRLSWYPITAESPAAKARAALERPAPEVLAGVAQGVLPAGALAADRQYVLVLDADGNILKSLLWTLANSGAWREAAFDMSAYAGRTVRVHVGTYNDGNGLRSAMYVDDVSLIACWPGAATSTATPSATASPTGTDTATPTDTVTPTVTSTPTVTPTPTDTPTVTSTPTVTPTSTVTSTPTATPTVTSTPTATSTPTVTSTPTATPGPVRLRLEPRVSSVDANEVLVLELWVDAGAQPVERVELALQFDPALLEVVDAAGNPAEAIDGDPGALGRVLHNAVDNAGGLIEYEAGQEPTGSPAAGTFRAASARFRARTTPGLGQVRYLDRSDAFYAGMALVTGREAAWIVAPGRVLAQLYLPMVLR